MYHRTHLHRLCNAIHMAKKNNIFIFESVKVLRQISRANHCTRTQITHQYIGGNNFEAHLLPPSQFFFTRMRSIQLVYWSVELQMIQFA